MDKIPRRKSAEKLDKVILFGLLMTDQISDNEHNISVSGHHVIKELIGDDTLKIVIDAYKRLDKKEIFKIVNESFSYGQKFFLISNMTELAFRDRHQHDHEIKYIEIILDKIDFPKENFEDILHY